MLALMALLPRARCISGASLRDYPFQMAIDLFII
jgi:hypothetical protein